MLTKDQMLEQYDVLGFAMGMCIVKRKTDSVTGTLQFRNVNDVRYYYDFEVA